MLRPTLLVLIIFSTLIHGQCEDNYVDCGENGVCPCLNGATCLANNAACRCLAGWAGARCEIAQCKPSNLCGPGKCIDPSGICDCTGTGYEGPSCKQPICDPPCLNGGSCSGPNTCNCTGIPWEETHCQQPKCTPRCKRGFCSAPNTCDCTGSGYKGPLCDEMTCEKPCLNGGLCTMPNFCNCTYTGGKYQGVQCEEPVCNPGCRAGGKCVAPDTCDCSTALPAGGWIGKVCEIPTCRNITCAHNTTCAAPEACDCRGTGWTGQDCSLDIDDCLDAQIKKIQLCDPMTSCTNTIGSFNCSDCPKGYAGTGKTGCYPHCSFPCAWGRNCTSPEQCDCSSTGYRGKDCSEDINECAEHGCDYRTNCTNIPGSFICGPCPEGYRGTGLFGCEAMCVPPCAEGYRCTKPGQCEIGSSSSLAPLLALTLLTFIFSQ